MALIDPRVSSVPSVRSVERVLDLLVALERAGSTMGVSELGRAAGMPKATAQRLLSVLERRGFIQKEQGRYQLGPGVVPLARAFLSTNTIAIAAHPVLEQLAVASGEGASLYVRDGYHRVVLERVESPYTLRVAARVGQRLPLHLGAGGQVLMAGMQPEEIDRYLDSIGEIQMAGGEVLPREQFLAKLERVRRQGFAISFGERRAGVIAVAAPVIRPGRGTVAAISVSGPPARMTPEKVEQISIEARRAAEEVAEGSRRR